MFIRQSTIAVRHGTTPSHIYQQWCNEGILANVKETFLLEAWVYVSPATVEAEICRQLVVIGAD